MAEDKDLSPVLSFSSEDRTWSLKAKEQLTLLYLCLHFQAMSSPRT